MKSIGNGWKRAQIARNKAERDSRNRSYATQYAGHGTQISTTLRDILAPPSIHQEIREAIQTGLIIPPYGRKTTLWQRIKRAMRAL